MRLAIRAGAQAYLLQPFDAAQIKHVAERWFGGPLEGEKNA